MKIKIISQYQYRNFCGVLLFLLILISSCYSVDDSQYLNISFDNSKVSSQSLREYIDKTSDRIPDSIVTFFYEDENIPQNERVVHFKNKPEEWYLIDFSITPCWILAIYNPDLSDSAFTNYNQLSDKELIRIKKRFELEILNKVK
ncbi:hypothetical protein A5893_16545 [Pedobacter psychrophilus]|uniref:Lipoprotein n=1 Tax=Pedobacter psychrophilus TaxID=1826909 RepID=A0A179DA98_9SPHI|nr:hypothetical protein [Pedobacter psychrophilus]OAQ37976.1 hypothetical protein A5893_16545 [Pedobacter psychrophilus]